MSAESHVIDEWYSIDVEPKLNQKIDKLQQIISEQSILIQTLSAEINILKSEMTTKHDRSSVQKDRMNELLEELKVIKQRELNMLIREKIPCPFFPIPSTIFHKKNISPDSKLNL